ncbi:hypothetical protein DSO57_1012443 [Entomophthora muscae]|uniref:Uncharacterized protein n=1 Tax=Entomophthora muscae TaxID=34485 RepID=A0ACC2S7V2_9FUNG|nr:hypothetical protein DSO57_1012443 [Entomophthora muscae]
MQKCGQVQEGWDSNSLMSPTLSTQRARMPHQHDYEATKNSIAGAGAGLVAAIVTCPLDVVKTRLQNQGLSLPTTAKYPGTRACLVKIWSEEGLRGLYRGLGPTICGYLPTWAIYFTAYEAFKSQASFYLQKPDSSHQVHIVGAMSAGALCTLSTSPLWVIKTRIMTQSKSTAYRYQNTLDAFYSIYRTEGIRGYYKGLIPSLLGVSHRSGSVSALRSPQSSLK